MRWSTNIVTPPAIEPVTLAEAKLYARVDVADDDVLITDLIVAARETVESFLRRKLITTKVDYFRETFPGSGGIICLPFPPLLVVDSVKYFDSLGVQQTVASADYTVDAASDPGRIAPSPDALTWESTERRLNAVEIRYDAGYGVSADDVPSGIKTAIKLLVTDMYEHRETQSEIRLHENNTAMNLLMAKKVPIEI